MKTATALTFSALVRRYLHSIRREQGASLIEFLIVLPIILLAIFIIIHVSIVVNGKTALRSAVSNATRLAFTRGNPATLGADAGVIGKLDNYYGGGACLGLDDVFIAGHNPGWSDGCNAAVLHYEYDEGCDVFQCSDASCDNLREYPLYYFYFLAYASLGMRQALGGAVRFPCDPSDPDLGDGCFLCRFLNPAPLDPDEPNSECETYDLDERGPPPGVYVRCRYRPSAAVLRPIYGLLRQSTGDSSWGMLEVEWHYP